MSTRWDHRQAEMKKLMARRGSADDPLTRELRVMDFIVDQALDLMPGAARKATFDDAGGHCWELPLDGLLLVYIPAGPDPRRRFFGRRLPANDYLPMARRDRLTMVRGVDVVLDVEFVGDGQYMTRAFDMSFKFRAKFMNLRRCDARRMADAAWKAGHA